MSRSFHNLTSNYNIYFNGYESYKKGLSRVEDSYQENFTRLLPVFYFSDESVAQTVSSDMQRALEKATKVITLHSITAKPELKKGPQSPKQKDFYNKKEFNRWIDDNYLLMGKAYVYKNEFNLALETFKKIIADFSGEESVYEAFIWMARTYAELKEYREAEKILDNLKNEEDFPKKLDSDLNISYADLYIKQNQNSKAIPYLEKALEGIRKKHYRIRYTYLLAQLYQEQENASKSIENYRKVIKMNPPYEMTFTAKINMASSFEAGSGEGKEFMELLKKMLKDDKNIEYQDQIYYALGNIALKQGNEERAIEYYKLSTLKSVQNTNQKGLSYLAIGDIYYQKPEYSLAQAYYDSSIQNIDQKYDYYEELSAKAGSLNHLVQHLDIFTLEDSLQRLSAMTEEERFAVIDKIIEDVAKKEEEERKKEQEAMQDMQYGMSMGNQTRANTTTQGGKWYFYNMNAKSFGQPEFRMKWGNRKLEDNWRRKNKQSMEYVSPEVTEELSDSTGTGEIKILSNKSREYYLKDIPFSDSAIDISNQRIEKALYNMGVVYLNELYDEKEAIDAYNKGIERFPKGDYALLSAYDLYEYYNRKGPADKSAYYKRYVIENFPESPRAKILSDPGYVESLQKEQNRANVLYDETYNAYNSGEYSRVISNCDYAFTQFRGDPTMPRFKLLRALSIGKLEGNDRLTDELQIVIEQFPGHEVATYAKNVIDLVYNMSPEIAVANVEEEAEEIYKYEENVVYYFGISTRISGDYNQLRFNLINFNLDNFDRLNLAISEEEIGGDKIIFVKTFDNYENARRYYDTYNGSRAIVYKDVDPAGITAFLISDYNYQVLLGDTELRKYYLYFRKYYQP